MIRTTARACTIYDLLAPPLILVTPFIDFTQHNGYGYTAPSSGSVSPELVAIGLLSGLVMALGGTWLRVLGTAGLLTLFVDLQFDWFDSLPHLWVPVGLLGAILLCWLTRKHLSRVVTADVRRYARPDRRALRPGRRAKPRRVLRGCGLALTLPRRMACRRSCTSSWTSTSASRAYRTSLMAEKPRT